MMLSLMTVSVAGALLAGSAFTAAAQEAHQKREREDVHLRNDCRLAVQVLTQGEPENKREWALTQLPSCGPEAGTLIARAFLARRGDQEHNAKIRAVSEAAVSIQDQAVLQAALAVAADREAGEVARVQAIRILWHQLVPGGFEPYDTFVQPDFHPGLVIDRWPAAGQPLSDGAESEGIRVLVAITEERTAPASVRLAAGHVLGAVRARVRRREVCPPGTSSVECARRFREDLRQRNRASGARP